MSDDIKKGLLGIVVDETEVSKVMPEINSLTYRGYAAQDLCEYCRFEEVAYMWRDAKIRIDVIIVFVWGGEF